MTSLGVKALVQNLNTRLKKIKRKVSKNRVFKIEVHSILGYYSLISVTLLMVGMNLFNFLVCISIKYPELNISIYDVKEESDNISTLKKANEILSESEYKNSNVNHNTKDSDTNINKSIILQKLKYRNTILKEVGDTINNISLAKRKEYLKKIEKTLIDINSVNGNNNSELDNITVKLLALEDILNNSLSEVDVEENKQETIEFNSAPDDNKLSEIKRKVTLNNIKDKLAEEKIPTEDIKEPVVEKLSEAPLLNSIKLEKDRLIKKLNAKIFDGFKLKVLKDDNYFLEKGVWYTYTYSKYHGFGVGVKPSEDDLIAGGLNKNTTLLLLDNSLGATFITDYKKVKLINNQIIANVTNKNVFLNQLVEDKKHLHIDTDKGFISLKEDTLKLTRGLSYGAKISRIYSYILRNISYSTFDLNNKKIFSGINTFEDKVGLCGGYTKLYLYMLSFAGVNDVQVLKGHVLDASDFPNIGHAWVRIGNKYYDPTFDDPVGATYTKTYNQYKYFGLPKDLFYTNRYNFGALPEYLKLESKQLREKLIQDNLSKLTSKYDPNKFILLKPFAFRKQNSLSDTEAITIDKIKKIVPYHEVSEYKYIDNGTEKIIKHIDYYTLTEDNINQLLSQIQYKLDGFKLFKWDDGKYRLAYNTTLK